MHTAQTLHEGERTRASHLREAHGFIGLRAETRGDRAAAAGHYRAIVDLGPSTSLHYAWARTRLRQWSDGLPLQAAMPLS